MNMALSKTGRRIKRKLTAKRKKAFLEELRRHGIVVEAARVASPHSRDRHGCASSFRDERNRDPEFSAAWAEAQDTADANLLMEARRRAVEGVDRGIFQKGGRAVDHDGSPATEKIYSDRLMELLLKSRFPNSFIEKRAIEHSGHVDHTMNGLLITPADLIVLNPEQRNHLQSILATIADHRGETIEHHSQADIAVLPAPKKETVQ